MCLSLWWAWNNSWVINHGRSTSAQSIWESNRSFYRELIVEWLKYVWPLSWGNNPIRTQRVKCSYSLCCIVYFWRMLNACYMILHVVHEYCQGPQWIMPPCMYVHPCVVPSHNDCCVNPVTSFGQWDFSKHATSRGLKSKCELGVTLSLNLSGTQPLCKED